MAGSSPALPATVRALHFYRENIAALSSLVDSRRIAEVYYTNGKMLYNLKHE